jgi:hypothetical protein
MPILQIFIFVLIGVILLWFGYRLFFRMPNGKNRPRRAVKSSPSDTSEPGGVGGQAGDPQTCPVCLAKLPPGMLVKSAAFPTLNGKDRLMHIMGCPFCLEGPTEHRRPRVCPVCHKPIAETEFLFARIFDRPEKTHVHVLGCMNCRGPHAMR